MERISEQRIEKGGKKRVGLTTRTVRKDAAEVVLGLQKDRPKLWSLELGLGCSAGTVVREMVTTAFASGRCRAFVPGIHFRCWTAQTQDSNLYGSLCGK